MTRLGRQPTLERAISPPLTPSDDRNRSDPEIVAHVKRWLDQFVIELDLCPFARKERVADRVRFVVIHGSDEGRLLESLSDELAFLEAHKHTETTLLIHPETLTDFGTYNQFLDAADATLDSLGLRGAYQIASFHPHYQFADTAPDDVENFTNRSPYPMLHLLRESSVERAVTQHPNVDSIPQANIDRLNALGRQRVLDRLQAIDEGSE